MNSTCILFGGEKGGTGKSTIAMNIAIMSSLMEHDVLFIDTDKQRSTAKWFARRNEKENLPIIPCVHIMGKFLHSEIESLASRYEVIIIDAGGRDSVELRSAMVCPVVTKLYSPLRPSEFDLDTVETLDELTELSLTYNQNLQTSILFNMCPSHAKTTTVEEAKDVIEETFSDNLCISPITIAHRVAYQHSVSHSKSVVEYEADEIKRLPPYQARKYLYKASKELMALYREIFNEQFTPLIRENTNPIDKKVSA